LKSDKYGQLLFRIANYFKVRNVLELGTSLGVTTAYLATSSTEIKCVSLEGCTQIAAVAKENLQKIGSGNVEIVVGNIDKTLDEVLSQLDKLDLIFLDANHKYESVLCYFDLCLSKIHNDSVLIVDDIYWSKDMEKAWATIKNHPQVMSTIDLFQLGIVFFNADLYKNHYKMRY
jgi:predicted O-methyltransferase YrrM